MTPENPTPETPTPETPAPQPLRSKHTPNLAGLLHQLGISLLITTYQAGKLVILRSDGEALHTHFRDFSRPMGLAADRSRLAVGTVQGVHYFRNMPTVCRYLDPPDRHDACYLTRSVHITGGINIHEMAWVGEELWFVNTRFSCLCTLDNIHSFVPRWRPSFISSLGPDDRCHLNGLGLMDGQVRFATALAAADKPQGWRDHKKDGGILLEVPSSAVLLRGLSMPHSPRWHGGRLWLLESGKGGVGYLDAATGRYEAICELPGFTRGLDFHGPLAFVGLSQVRESAIFSGIPITERALPERSCGVWVVDVRSGQTVAVLRFEDAVQEVFAVQVLPGLRWPEVGPDDPKFLSGSYDLPQAALRDVPPALRDMTR